MDKEGYYKIQNVGTGKYLTADYVSVSADMTKHDNYSLAPAPETCGGDSYKFQQWRLTRDFSVKSKIKDGCKDLPVYSLNAVYKPWNGVRKGSEVTVQDQVVQMTDQNGNISTSAASGEFVKIRDVYTQKVLEDNENSCSSSEEVTHTPNAAALWKLIRLDEPIEMLSEPKPPAPAPAFIPVQGAN